LTAKTPFEQADALQAAGYATAPNYADSLKTLISKYNLETFDKMEDSLSINKIVIGLIVFGLFFLLLIKLRKK